MPSAVGKFDLEVRAKFNFIILKMMLTSMVNNPVVVRFAFSFYKFGGRCGYLSYINYK